MQMEIIAAGKIIKLILIYHAINWFIAYRDRPIDKTFKYNVCYSFRLMQFLEAFRVSICPALDWIKICV